MRREERGTNCNHITTKIKFLKFLNFSHFLRLKIQADVRSSLIGSGRVLELPSDFGEMKEEETLKSIIHHWKEWCQCRGRKLRSIREPLQAWHSLTKKEKFLRDCEKKARRALRAQRQQYMLGECLRETASRKLADAARVVDSINDGMRIPIADRLDNLLEKYDRQNEDTAESDDHQEAQPLHSLSKLDTNIEHEMLPIDLMVMAGCVQQTMKLPRVDERLTERHYISTGIDEDPLFSSLYSPTSRHEITAATDAYVGFVDAIDSDAFEKENVTEFELDEMTATLENTLRHDGKTSLVDSIASTAQTNLHNMKRQVHESLRDVRGSQVHLTNYREFIEKKTRQRIQCLRDLKEHCCTCRGPHIAKPPFSHGKDYRREPTHPHCQNETCSFIRKKKSELEWLDETIGKYGSNQERFERDILKWEVETERKKASLKDELANSLRLMEIVN